MTPFGGSGGSEVVTIAVKTTRAEIGGLTCALRSLSNLNFTIDFGLSSGPDSSSSGHLYSRAPDSDLKASFNPRPNPVLSRFRFRFRLLISLSLCPACTLNFYTDRLNEYFVFRYYPGSGDGAGRWP
ncbi:hypothetical protein EVAR_77348_1 [Eumeta japonica]|uniref:Uncharacterized protein n=1 Tax=Eumeta variegata TaxID=151549 RepID=A0A4C1UX25_EUMVA|nr:hypothetical protein EVAR_77348_1 [Eumeta japonica]